MSNRIEITSKSQFFKEAHARNYMTISKDYGLLATDGSKRTGEFIWALPHGENPNPVGWVEERNQGLENNESHSLPSVEQIEALKRFADQQGRTWKEELKSAWMTGIYPRPSKSGDTALLQQVRNKKGPEWLTKVKLEELA